MFVHIEAGLRSSNFNHPFPLEYNRRIVSLISEMNFAPTETSKINLLKEQIKTDKIMLVGNTVVDALQLIRNNENFEAYQLSNTILNNLLLNNSKICLITCQRRENHEKINQIINAIEKLAIQNFDIKFIWPVHPPPIIKMLYLNLD
ncbi:MAG: UDP-N-acetylglucosamine 2-epimerase [Flavobacterium sp.]|nr:UDP-N-acetylglucosamine 2-epimerase [Flavobacterium sp.]